jgi:hypothetical protein
MEICRPLEMSSLSTSSKKRGSPKGNGNGNGRVPAGRIVRGARNSRSKSQRAKSLVSLASEDDLLKRRMNGLTGYLLDSDGAMPSTP